MADYVKYEQILRSHLVRREASTDGKDRFVAWLPQLEGCKAQADTADEAVAMLYEMIPGFLVALREVGAPENRIGTEAEAAVGVKFGFRQAVATTLGTTTSRLWPAPFVPA